MRAGKRVLTGSVLAVAVSGVVAGAAVSAFANGPASEWSHRGVLAGMEQGQGHAVLAIQQYGPFTTTGPASVSNATAVEYGHTVPVSNVLDDVSA